MEVPPLFPHCGKDPGRHGIDNLVITKNSDNNQTICSRLQRTNPAAILFSTINNFSNFIHDVTSIRPGGDIFVRRHHNFLNIIAIHLIFPVLPVLARLFIRQKQATPHPTTTPHETCSLLLLCGSLVHAVLLPCVTALRSSGNRNAGISIAEFPEILQIP